MRLLTRRTRTLTAITAVAVLAVNTPSAAIDYEDIPEPTSLNGSWRFQLKEDAKAADALRWFFEEGTDTSGWDTITVPSNWNLEGFEEPHYVDGTPAEGFYVKSFEIPKEAADLRVLLHFGGVWMSAEAWLNGRRLGRHDSGFTGFSFDISHEMRPGEENRLAVRVRQQVQPDLFKFDANDDWALAGIYRDVWIEYTPREMVMEGVEVETDFDERFEDAELRARVFVARWENADFFAASDPFELKATLRSAKGEVVAEKTRTQVIHGAHNGNDFRLTLPVESPASWTAETPNLYSLTIELLRDGRVADRWEDRIGFREISTEGGVLRVNGQAVKLRGVARHDQHPDVGRATREEHWLEDIRLMKAANINAVRTAHYPPAEGFVRLCDEHGLYVINEIPLGFGGDRFWEPSFAEGMYLRIHETIRRDRNRPSVIAWSFGNEDPFSALHLAGLRTIKGLDPTRPTLLPFRAETDLPPEVDILAPHYWTAERYDALAATSARPVITTEYTHALGSDDFGEFEDRWNALVRHPAGAGGMIWLWADQGLRRSTEGQEVFDPMEDKDRYTRKGAELVADKWIGENTILDSHGNYGTDGIVDADREPQRDYWETQAVYAPVQVIDEWIRLEPHAESIFVRVRNGFDFLDLSAVTLDWELFRDARSLDSGTARLEAPPHATAFLELPADQLDPAQGIHYAHITIRREDGSVMAEESVRIGEAPSAGAELPDSDDQGELFVEENGDGVTVRAGGREYVFRRGEIAEVSVAGSPLVEHADIVVWRPATDSERNRLDKRDRQHDWVSFMQGLEPLLQEAAIEKNDQRISYRTVVEYRADAENSAVVEYRYAIDRRGQLDLEYSVEVDLDVDWIPEVGVALKLVDRPLNVRWQGQGIRRSTPGKTAATRFGVWEAPVFSGEARGTKSSVDWLEIADARGQGLRAVGMTAFRLDGVLDEGSTLRLLSHLAGSWTKNGPGEHPARVLELEGRRRFEGSFRLMPQAGSEPAVAESAAGPQHPAVLGAAFINPDAPYPSCHASTIAESASGEIVAAWFGGTRERHPDVGIWFARQENGQWQPATEVANGLQEDGERFPTWNPVLFQPGEGPLHLFYKVGPSPSSWWGMVMHSDDGGRSWSEPRRLPEGILGPIKNKPVELADGTWLSPSSTEGKGWRLHFERSMDEGRRWERIGPVEQGGYDSIQPSILIHGDGVLQAINRTKQGVLSTTWSQDNGETWSPTEASELPNPGSGTDAVTLQDGRHLLVYNHSSPPTERPHKGVRYPLNVAVSEDGVHWRMVLTLETLPRPAGYAYPAVIQDSQGRIHITYTWDRDRIKHVVLDPEEL